MANPNVFAAYLQRPKSVVEYMDEADARDAQRNRNALEALVTREKAAGLQAEADDRNALQRLASQHSADPTAYERALLTSGRAGLMRQGQAMAKARLDAEKIGSDIAKDKAETETKQFALRRDKRDQALKDIAALGSSDEARASLEAHFQAGDIDQTKYQAVLATIPQNPADFPMWQLKMLRGIMNAKDAFEASKPTIDTRNLGGTTQTRAIDPLTGQVQVTATAQNTQSPDNAATVGASYANAAALREQANATRDAARIRRDQDTEMKLADDYRTQSKDFKESATAYKQITSALESATKSPAATLAAATKFMKILDPGSVVRESELGMALAATGVIDRAKNYMNTLQMGKVLTESQVADFKKISREIYKASEQVQKDIDKSYREKAKAYNLRPEMIVQDLGQGSGVVDFADLK